MKKKYSAMILACVLLFGILTACSLHEHTELTWKADKENHRQECECGKVLNSAEHTLDDDGYCEECNMVIVDYGDGFYDILTFDEQGTMSGCMGYDAQGSVLYSQILDYEYYEDGNAKSYKEYHDGELVCESTFLYNSTGNAVYESESVFYLENGYKSVSTYNENNMLLTYTEYDAEGNVVNEDIYEYTPDYAGNLTIQTCISNGVISSVATYESDAEGNYCLVNEVFYDENGNITDDYSYDAESD